MSDSRDDGTFTPKKNRLESKDSFKCEKPRRLSEYQTNYEDKLKRGLIKPYEAPRVEMGTQCDLESKGAFHWVKKIKPIQFVTFNFVMLNWTLFVASFARLIKAFAKKRMCQRFCAVNPQLNCFQTSVGFNVSKECKMKWITAEIYLCVLIVGIEILIGVVQILRLSKKLLIISILACVLSVIEMASDLLPQ